MLNKMYNQFEKMIIFITLIIAMILTVESFYGIHTISDEINRGRILLIVGLWLFSFISVGLILAYKWVRRIGNRGQIIIFVLMAIMMFFIRVYLISRYDIRPLTDSLDDFDVAYSLLKNPDYSRDNAFSQLMGMYGNNYIFIIILKQFLSHLKGYTPDVILKIAYVLNATILSFSEILFWLSVKKIATIQKANIWFLLIFLNPLEYMLVFWAYTNTVSVFFTMVILYLALRLYQSSIIAVKIMYATAIGAFAVLGYKIRPTSIFILIAIMIVALGIMIRDKRLVRTIMITGPCILIMFIAGLLYMKNLENKHFSQVKNDNLPVTYWLAMGSSGSGTLDNSFSIMESISDIPDPHEKNRILIQQVKENYKNAGISGTVNLWFRKMCTTWGDGYSDANIRMFAGQWSGKLYEVLAGEERIYVQLFAQIHRMLLWFLSATALYIMWKKKASRFEAICCITVFGAVVFYWLWEAKNVYSFPFLAILSYLSVNGIEYITDVWENNTIKIKNMKFHWIIIVTSLFVCMNLYYDMTTIRTYDYKVLSGNANSRVMQRIVSGKDQPLEIVQDCYISNPFNKLLIFCKAESRDASECSPYELTIANEQGTMTYTQIVYATIANNILIIDLPQIVNGNHYYFYFRKMNPEKRSIIFYTHATEFFDLYNGELVVDGDIPYHSDLSMDVVNEIDKPFLSPKKSFAVTGILFLFSVCLNGLMTRNYISRKE